MTKIFKQLARHWAVCLVVFALLFVQAYCDLSLPDYTSKIVDTGIQQGGIESPLPATVRQSTLDALSLLMREEDAAAFQNAYTADGDVLRLRTDLTADERTALEDAVTTPDIVLYLAATQAANTPAGQTGMDMTGLADLHYCAQRVERVAGILRYQGDLLSVKTGQGSVVCQNICTAVENIAAASDIIGQNA